MKQEFKEGDIIELIDSNSMVAIIGAKAKVIEYPSSDSCFKNLKYSGIEVKWISGDNGQIDGGYGARIFKLIESVDRIVNNYEIY